MSDSTPPQTPDDSASGGFFPVAPVPAEAVPTDGAPAQPEATWPPPLEDRPETAVRRGAIIAAILLPFIVAVLGLVWALQQDQNPRLAEAGTPGTATVETLPDGAYSLWARNADGTAVRWNSCEPIRWVFSPNGAPLGAVEALQTAMGLIEDETGLVFELLGETDELPARDRKAWQPERYDKDKWAPVLISWRTPTTTDAPLRDVDRAVAIPVAIGNNLERSFVTAQIIFNRDSAGSPGFSDRRNSIGITMLHELMHVVGLQHVDVPSEIMFPFPVVGSADFGNGDRAGLREVGADHPCLETPEPEELVVEYR